LTGTVYKSTGSWYSVKTEEGDFYDCKIKGKLRLEKISSTNPIVVGDKVDFVIETQDEVSIGVIQRIHERNNYIVRKSVNLSKQSHILASNIDLLVLVVTLKDPITTTSFIDRFLVNAEAYSIETLLVFNKNDIYDKQETIAVNNIIKVYLDIGYKCLKTSVINNHNILELKKIISDKTIMFGGHSGVGKTSLINSIDSSLDLKVGDISSQHLQGKHTTTYAEIFDLDMKTKLIDTPGIKGFGLINFEKQEIRDLFPEFLKYKNKCKFSDCLHLKEPNCFIKLMVNKNKISKSRYQSYSQILADDNLKHR
jgi:ribosome biogenesis GTPase|tara:strand:- start:325 stop:1254 length:930 start_codon:yes stop_codon:yes gene_type:complete